MTLVERIKAFRDRVSVEVAAPDTVDDVKAYVIAKYNLAR